MLLKPQTWLRGPTEVCDLLAIAAYFTTSASQSGHTPNSMRRKQTIEAKGPCSFDAFKRSI